MSASKVISFGPSIIERDENAARRASDKNGWLEIPEAAMYGGAHQQSSGQYDRHVLSAVEKQAHHRWDAGHQFRVAALIVASGGGRRRTSHLC